MPVRRHDGCIPVLSPLPDRVEAVLAASTCRLAHCRFPYPSMPTMNHRSGPLAGIPATLLRIAVAAAIVGVVMWFQPRINEPAAQVSNGLNLRSAPDPRAERLALLPVGTTVEVQRCLDDLQWCNVRAGGHSGWVAANYLVATRDGKRVRLAEAGKEMGVVIETAQPGG